MLAAKIEQSDPAAPAVLLVEDEPLIRALLAETLRGAGYVVIEAADADEAWSYLTSAGGGVDLLFSDVTMPGSMNGVELVRRAKTAFPDIAAIITSGNPGPENIAALGIFLPKPYRLDEAARVASASLVGRIRT
jgi:CheY-like chemotaxis protein